MKEVFDSFLILRSSYEDTIYCEIFFSAFANIQSSVLVESTHSGLI